MVMEHLLRSPALTDSDLARMLYAKPLAANLFLLRARASNDERMREIQHLLLHMSGRPDKVTLELLRDACAEPVCLFACLYIYVPALSVFP